jgi:hypothetical protein
VGIVNYRVLATWVSILFFCWVSGCKHKIEAGSYSGNLLIHSLSNLPDLPHEPVQFKIETKKKTVSLSALKIGNEMMPVLQPITVSQSTRSRHLQLAPKGLEIIIPDLSPTPFALQTKTSSHSQCLSHQSETEIELCFS